MSFSEVKLPGWQTTSIGELVTFHRGVSYKRTDVQEAASPDNIPILRATNIQGSLTLNDPVYIPARLVKPSQRILENDIVIAMSSGSKSIVGKTAQATNSLNAAHGAFCGVARPKISSVAGYLGYIFKSKTYRAVVTNSSKGTSINNLKIDHVLGIKFSLPPLAEQERIVDKIDELFSAIKAGERAIDQARIGVARYRKAILKAAVTGELTKDWRDENPTKESAEDLLARILTARYDAWEKAELAKLDAKGKARPETDKQWEKFRGKYNSPVEPVEDFTFSMPQSWELVSVETVTSAERVISYGVLQPGKEYSGGTRLVRVCDIKNGQIEQSKIKKIDPNIAANYQRTFLRGGELLITLVGTVGRTAIVKEPLIGANVARAVGVLTVSGALNTSWLEFCFNEEKSKQNLIGSSREVARKTLNLEQLRSFPVPLPPFEEQDEIVNRVEQALSKADAVEATLDAQSRAAKALKQAVLKTAFEGKLVPQNPNDEPASELLKRIKAAS